VKPLFAHEDGKGEVEQILVFHAITILYSRKYESFRLDLVSSLSQVFEFWDRVCSDCKNAGVINTRESNMVHC
jgi:hypothetical protein